MRKLLVLAAFAAGVLLVALLALACGRGAVDSVIDASVTLLPARPPEPNLGSSYPTCQNTTALGGVPWVVGGHQQTVCAQPDAGLEVLVALADGGWEWLPYAGGGGSASFADGSGIPLVVDGASAGNLACTNGQLVMADGGAGYWVCGPTAAQVFTAGGDLSGSATSQTVDGLQGRTLSANAPVECNNLQWDGGSWGPSSVNLAGDAGCIQGTLGIGNGGTGLTSASSAGEYPRSNGSALVMSVIPSADIATALTTPGPIGAATANTVAATDFKADGGTTIGTGSLGPNTDIARGVQLPISTWATIGTLTFGSWNQHITLADTFVCQDFSALGGDAASPNYQRCTVVCDGMVPIDGGVSLSTGGQTGIAGQQNAVCFSPYSCSGPFAAYGLSDGGVLCGQTLNPAFSFQCVTSGTAISVQVAVDAGTYLCGVEDDHQHAEWP